MASERSLLLFSIVTVTALAACAHDDPRRFALRAPVLRDQDLDPVVIACKAEKGDPEKCAPEIYESSFAWDAADNSLFRPASDFFLVKRAGAAHNVNAFDEVPDSGWFTNRIGTRSMTPEEVFDGFYKPGPMLDGNLPDGSWLIDHGKDNGANPGFRVKVDGTKYMLKTDESQGERATAATAIASRFYYAAGWWAPCDAIVYFKRSILKLKDGLTIKANVGPPKKFDEALLGEILGKAQRRGDRYRAAASRWLPGSAMGPFTYEGRRSDDPSDVIPHEHRRDLRGARVIAAWLNHFDSREQNSMITWEPIDEKKTPWRGVTRHWYIDLGDCFGSEWTVDGFSKRHGYSYILDFRWILEDLATLGIPSRPWDDDVTRTPGFENYGYFTAKYFDPDEWKGEYPNPAFQNLQEGDGAWATRIIARFTRAHIEAALKAGDLTKPEDTQFLLNILLERQMIIQRRYFRNVSPLADVTLEGDRLCAVDLARKTKTYPDSTFRYSAAVLRGTSDRGRAEPATVDASTDGGVCLSLPSRAPDGGAPDDDRSRYVIVQIANGASRGPLVAHFYDLGPRKGLRLVGLERPE